MELSISDLKALISAQHQPETPRAAVIYPYELGKGYFIRTVTHHYTGRLVDVTLQELVVEDAAWIADDGRFSDALKTGEFAEVEPFPNGRVIIGRGTVLDAVQISTPMPRSQK